ncbi:MAG TPA: hypothetical protein DF729_11810 [Hafnia paralvei]|nr:hypothetical protein [Hafnia paralvei]
MCALAAFVHSSNIVTSAPSDSQTCRLHAAPIISGVNCTTPVSNSDELTRVSDDDLWERSKLRLNMRLAEDVLGDEYN